MYSKVISLFIGVMTGVTSSCFLYSLSCITSFRLSHPLLILGLPLAGLLIGFLYQNYGKDFSKGNSLVFEEIHFPKKWIAWTMAPLIFIATIITHLFGGSAGREGTAVQIAFSLTDALSKKLGVELSSEQRRKFLYAAIAAAFSAILGAPFAGMMFALEIVRTRPMRFLALPEICLASMSAYFVSSFLRVPHFEKVQVYIPPFSFKLLMLIVFAGIIFGAFALFFSVTAHRLQIFFSKIFSSLPLRAFMGGCILVILYLGCDLLRFSGLGIESISGAFRETEHWTTPLIKSLLTSLTLASGFKGGEFVPLVFIGATLGSSLAILLPSALSLLSALGCVAVFAGAAHFPISCSIWAIEMFGMAIFPYALIVCLISYRIIPRKYGIYSINP